MVYNKNQENNTPEYRLMFYAKKAQQTRSSECTEILGYCGYELDGSQIINNNGERWQNRYRKEQTDAREMKKGLYK